MQFRRYGSLALAMALLSTPALAYDPMGDEESFARFGEAVRTYIVENPEILLEAQQALQEKQAIAMQEQDAQTIQDNLEALLDNPWSPVYGNPDAEFTIVKFNDYFCGFCRNASVEVEQFLDQVPDVRIVVQEFPILGEDSFDAARFSVAVNALGGQEAYEAVKPLLYSAQDITEDYLARMIEASGLPSGDVMEMMNGPEVMDYIASVRELAQVMELTGTPAFIIGNTAIRGFIPVDDMLEIHEQMVN